MKDTRSNAELNRIISEWCGWTPGTVINFTNGEEHYPWPKNAPDYCGDLNAIHEVEGKIERYRLWRITTLLANIVDADTPIAHATARQRAEALVKVIEAKGGK